MRLICLTLIMAALCGGCLGFRAPRPKALVVNCQSQSGNAEFRHRLKWRKNAEDQATIWLFGGEQLRIHFHLDSDATVEVLDVRYSNDGGFDDISVHLDNIKLGDFKTHNIYAFGILWNDFRSAGPIGGHRFVNKGDHTITLSVDNSDEYGVEIDYIRVNVHGSKIQNLENEHFFCEHRPSEDEDYRKW